MTIQIRGRYRRNAKGTWFRQDRNSVWRPTAGPRWTWLLATVGAFALFVVLALAATAAFAAPGIQAEYGGARWPTNTKPVCFTTGTISDTRWTQKVQSAAKSWDSKTDNLRIITRTDCKASGYSQIVKVYAKNYGDPTKYECNKNSYRWWGCTKYGALKWQKVPSNGPWTTDGWTWTFDSPLTIRLNSKYGVSSWVAAFEIGRALGLTTANRYTTNALMAYGSTADWLTFWDVHGYVGSNKPGVDALYWKG